MPSSLALSGVKYTLVDDNRLGAASNFNHLFSYYLAKDQRHSIKFFPAEGFPLPDSFWRACRNHRICARLRKRACGGFAAIGNNLEKFGVWPGTNKLCYSDGWLENFSSRSSRIRIGCETAAPASAVSSRPPLGRADLPPTASYSEMMESVSPHRRAQPLSLSLSTDRRARKCCPFFTAALLPMIMTIGHVLEERSLLGSQEAIRALSRLTRIEARRLTLYGEIEEVEAKALRVDDR